MSGKAGKGVDFKARTEFISRGFRKTSRGPLDTNDSCCFDVEPGDYVSVMANGSKKFVNCVVLHVRNPTCFCYEFPALLPDNVVKISNDIAVYEDFTRRWKFGWVEPRTRSDQEFHGVFEDYVKREYPLD